MNLTDELEHATTWFQSLTDEDQSHIQSLENKLLHAISDPIIPREPLSILDVLIQSLKEELGSLSTMVLGDRERIEKALHANIVLVLFRLSLGQKTIPELLDVVLASLDRFLSYFQKFLDKALQKGAHPFQIDEREAQKCAEVCVSFVCKKCFPSREKSLFIPVPSFFLSTVQSYLKGAFEKMETKSIFYLRDFLSRREMKEELYASGVLALHRSLCTWEGGVPKATVSEEQLIPYQRRAEELLERAVLCLSSDPERVRRYFPKIQASPLVVLLLWNACTAAQSKLPLWIIRVCTQMLDMPARTPKGRCSSSGLPLDRVEEKVFQKSAYGPLFFRFIGLTSKNEHQETHRPKFFQNSFFSVLGSLAQGYMTSVAYTSFDSLPWDDIFRMGSFGLRRVWNFGLSQEILMCVSCREHKNISKS